MCVALIGSQVSKLRAMASSRSSRYWKFALACHCIYIGFYYVTFSSSTLWLFGALFVYCLILPLVNVAWAVISASGPTSAIELRMIIIPFLVSSICTAAWHFMISNIIRRKIYRFWLPTFDRDWRPEQAMGWLAPFSMRKFLRTGNGF